MADLACQHGKARSNVKGARCSSSVPPCLIPKAAPYFEEDKRTTQKDVLKMALLRACRGNAILWGCACIKYVKKTCQHTSTLYRHTSTHDCACLGAAARCSGEQVAHSISVWRPSCPGSGLSNLCRQASEAFAKRPHHTSRSGALKCGLAEQGLLQMMQHHRCLWTLAQNASWDTSSFWR